MTELWNYREHPERECLGYSVEATDGHIGYIDHASHDVDKSFLVVDTKWWIFEKQRLIPAGVIDRFDHREKKVYIKMTKDQVKHAPDYEPSEHDQPEVDHEG